VPCEAGKTHPPRAAHLGHNGTDQKFPDGLLWRLEIDLRSHIRTLSSVFDDNGVTGGR